ncbi:MAG: hypothetical protein K4571_17325 [Deltaproteobacteria bacterium]
MKIKTLLAVSMLLVFFVASGAQAAAKDGFWDNLQGKLQKVTPGKKTTVTTAVGGVRGAKNESDKDIYWKGKDKSPQVTEEELQKFQFALDIKIKGNNEEALKLFEEFMKAYPQSSLRVEGLQAIEKIKMEMAAAKNPDEAPAKKAPVKAAAKAAKAK